MAEDDYCYLTTTGRVSGEPHEIEIWYERDPAAPGTVFLLAGGGRISDWVRNLAADPAAALRFGSEAAVHRVAGRLLDDEAARADPGEDRRARDLVFAKYQPRGHGDLAGWRESALPVAVDLLG